MAKLSTTRRARPHVPAPVSGLAAVMIAASCLAAAGCASDATPSAAPPRGVSVSLQQWRGDVAGHSIEIAVRNAGPDPVYFSDVRLETASFAPLPAHRVDTTLNRTPRTDFPIPYGTARCDPEKLPQVAPATVVAHLRVGDEPLREVRFAMPDPDPLLARLLKAECGAYILRHAADVTFGQTWKRDGEALTGALTVTRGAGNAAVTIDDLSGTTHYNIAPISGKHRPVTVLEPGVRSLEIPVRITPTRCDPHAFAEAKQAYLFPVRGAVTGGESYVLIAVPPRPIQDVFLRYSRDVCGLS